MVQVSMQHLYSSASTKSYQIKSSAKKKFAWANLEMELKHAHNNVVDTVI